ncbi:AAA family ATPase, partial [Enterococcus faecalis]|nr:AAA family ATPase [Enterococcus faecalis]EGO8757374.1 DUF2813 domain-containing protein [Enterococcus faecalis]EGO8833214.1 DUF2813 domain-containing protein [Enterococcus faecalis]EGO9442232.1 hypothetical protein [Enterococcus faecalis]
MQEKNEYEGINLKQIDIEGLHGYYNVSIPLDKKANLFVGENGLGKTTILNIIYFLLKKEYAKLTKYDFKKITIKTSSGKEISLKYENLELVQYFENKKYNSRKKQLVEFKKNINRKTHLEFNIEQQL